MHVSKLRQVSEGTSAASSVQVRVVGVDILFQSGDATWAHSMTKLRFFELSQYQRLISFDADGLVMRSMDHLFSLPSAPVAMPRAYWLDQPRMCNALAVIEPSAQRLEELMRQAETAGKPPPTPQTKAAMRCFSLICHSLNCAWALPWKSGAEAYLHGLLLCPEHGMPKGKCLVPKDYNFAH